VVEKLRQSATGEWRLGIDLGGTKIEAALLDGQGGMAWRERVATPADDYAAILRAIRGLARRAEQVAGEELRVGIGTPGAVSPNSGLLRNSNTQCMNGRPLLEDLQQDLQRPVRIANDANCFALSEAVDGAAADGRVVFGVIIGTGTGGGLVIDRAPLTGRHAIAGEWGHNPLPWPQAFDHPRPCYCGRSGCIETYLSGPGFAANARADAGLELDARGIAECAAAGDALCQRQMEQYHDQLARALAHVINLLDPDVIVLGGGMSNIDSLYTEVPPLLERYVFSDFVDVPIRPPRHGDSSGVRGAAWLW